MNENRRSTDPKPPLISDECWKGFATGIIIGLTITLAVGLTAVIAGHLCIIQGAGSCARFW